MTVSLRSKMFDLCFGIKLRTGRLERYRKSKNYIKLRKRENREKEKKGT